MTCDEASVLLHALIDGELDAGHARDVEAHVATCPRCSAQLAAYREMRAAMTRTDLRFTAPASLRSRIEASLPSPQPQVQPRRTDRRALLKGFAFGSVVSGAIAAGLLLVVTEQDRNDRLVGEVIAAHLRSLQAGHATDVASTDQHTVKPWFNGRLDAAPPVVDLTAQGFTLLGGRLDYIDGKAVAAIVYRRRIHVINLFVTESGNGVHAASLKTVQGFNIRRWANGGFDLWAISDLNADELKEFHDKFEATAAQGT